MRKSTSYTAPLFFSLLAHGVVAGFGIAAPHRNEVTADSIARLTSANPSSIGVSLVAKPKLSGQGKKGPVAALENGIATSTPFDGPPSQESGHSREPRGLPTSPERETYAKEVRNRIEHNLRYPLAVRRRGISGRVMISLAILPDGSIESPSTSQSSGSLELDHLALDAARASAPFPAPGIEDEKMGRLVLSLPIEFKLK